MLRYDGNCYCFKKIYKLVKILKTSKLDSLNYDIEVLIKRIKFKRIKFARL